MTDIHLPKHMRGIYLNGHGDFDQLELRHDIAIPDIGLHDVLIRVHAAGVNNTDINTRIGWYSKNNNADEDASWTGNAITFPRIQGIDVCGDIVAVGDSINTNRIGERVLVEPCLKEALIKPIRIRR
ncbi:MAG: alcohol dehydrogenase catalytic domain-containing protein [Gammaproteobacteria bacterium]|nr:alcohol dehydrogenase catalytic domain-containing protein [Gammaproteobacteria bacterium]